MKRNSLRDDEDDDFAKKPTLLNCSYLFENHWTVYHMVPGTSTSSSSTSSSRRDLSRATGTESESLRGWGVVRNYLLSSHSF